MKQKIYMVGIGGVGLSALAQLYALKGADVSGSDRSESPTTKMLIQKGIKVFIGQNATQVPEDANLLVYSDAVPADNPERARAEKLGIRQVSYFEALGEVARSYKVVAVAGTHGKTTVTAMLGKILIDADLDPTVVVGSIVPEWGSNFRPGKSDWLIVEACEYREHFLNFRPEILVVTNIEWDHTDYFKTSEDFEEAFNKMRFLSKVVIDYEQYSSQTVPELFVPGEFNKENARAAKFAAMIMTPEISEESINHSLANFKGTWRRFEYKGILPKGAILYDDYAHHPTAVEKTIQTAKEKFVDKKIFVFFHPHLYSRTKDFFNDFARALALADRAYILPVFGAREAHDPSVSNFALAKKIQEYGGLAQGINEFWEVEKELRSLDKDVVAFTMGAGDIYKAGEASIQ